MVSAATWICSPSGPAQERPLLTALGLERQIGADHLIAIQRHLPMEVLVFRIIFRHRRFSPQPFLVAETETDRSRAVGQRHLLWDRHRAAAFLNAGSRVSSSPNKGRRENSNWDALV